MRTETVWLFSMPFGVSAGKLKVWRLESLEDSFTYGGSWWLLAEDFSSSLCAFSWSLSLGLERAFTSLRAGIQVRASQETRSSCTFSWPGPRSHIASLLSSICWNCHKTPGFKGWWNRLYLRTWACGTRNEAKGIVVKYTVRKVLQWWLKMSSLYFCGWVQADEPPPKKNWRVLEKRSTLGRNNQ